MKLLVLAALAAALLAPSANAAVVYVSNNSTSVTDAQVSEALPAFQQGLEDLKSYWGVDNVLTTDPSFAKTADMTISIEDNSDQFGALGYHDVANGKPYARVFAADSAAYNEDWRLVFDHEDKEMAVDPFVNHFYQWNKRMWLAEVCDPTESGFYAYFVNGVPLSDFITPSWYGGNGRRDFMGRLKRPGQIGRHGYASYLTSNGWQQVFGS